LSQTGPHGEFLELCAVSTSGELTEGEYKRLRQHLAVCPPVARLSPVPVRCRSADPCHSSPLRNRTELNTIIPVMKNPLSKMERFNRSCC